MTDPAAGVQAWLEPRAEEMAALLERLVAIDTENPPGRGLGRCGRVLHEAMERLGLAPELIELAPSRELEDPCLVRGAAGDAARARSTSTGTSTSSRRRIPRSSARSGAPAGSPAAGPPT